MGGIEVVHQPLPLIRPLTELNRIGWRPPIPPVLGRALLLPISVLNPQLFIKPLHQSIILLIDLVADLYINTQI